LLPASGKGNVRRRNRGWFKRSFEPGAPYAAERRSERIGAWHTFERLRSWGEACSMRFERPRAAFPQQRRYLETKRRSVPERALART